MAVRLTLTFFALIALGSEYAHANDQVERHRGNKSKPTFFIGELAAGAAFGTGFEEGGNGYALRTVFGFGGAFKGFPPRFYFIVSGRYASLSANVQNGTSYSDIRRDLIDVSAGLRVLVPVHRFRFLGEVTMGQSVVNSAVTVNDRESYTSSQGRFTIYTALGAQYRFHRNLSLGLMAEWALPTSRASRDYVIEVSRMEDSGKMHGWTSVTGAVVIHF